MGGGAGRAVAKGGGERLMQSALKPAKEALESGAAKRAIKTLLGEGINITEGGVYKLQNLIDKVNASITNAIKNSPGMVNREEVIKATQVAVDKFKMQVNPQADLAQIQKGINKFVANPVFKEWGGPDIPVQLAQKLKQGTYKILGEKVYGELKNAEIEVQKQLARGLKDEVAKIVPGIAELNARDSALLEAHGMALARVLSNANKDPGGLAWLAHNPKTFMAFVLSRDPWVKSLIARALHQGVAGAAAGVGAEYTKELKKEIFPENQ